MKKKFLTAFLLAIPSWGIYGQTPLFKGDGGRGIRLKPCGIAGFVESLFTIGGIRW